MKNNGCTPFFFCPSCSFAMIQSQCLLDQSHTCSCLNLPWVFTDLSLSFHFLVVFFPSTSKRPHKAANINIHQIHEGHLWTTLVISFCCTSVPKSYVKIACLELMIEPLLFPKVSYGTQTGWQATEFHFVA